MNNSNILQVWSGKSVRSQRSKDIDKAALKFIKAVEEATTYDEVLNLASSHKNLSKALLSDSYDKDITKFIINHLHLMCLLKIKLIKQAE